METGARLAWLTDVHFEFLPQGEVAEFLGRVLDADPDAVLLGGDTGTAPTFPAYLARMEDALRRPVYFVLGNHDFHGGSIEEVRRTAAALTLRSRWLRWLPETGVVQVTPRTGLLGHGSWADGRLGSGAASTVLLNDYVQIRNFIPLDLAARFRKLNELGDEAAEFFARHLPEAADRFENL
ncbi:MAG: metallophosphoesterase, partial [Gemmatimonadota bacterium]